MALKKIALLAAAFTVGAFMEKPADQPTYALVIHGGAGTITPEKLTPELRDEIERDLKAALTKGQMILESGGKALDAVTEAIMILENSPHFNAGRGAVFTANGENELDSSVMDGRSLDAGAVSGVKNVKNPITLARAVMEKSPHVMMQGHGAEEFADLQGIERAENAYFFTDFRWQQLQDAKSAGQGAVLDHDGSAPIDHMASVAAKTGGDYKFGTVGAVARDINGNLAAGTSTGGMTNKMHGRVGDSPIIGAGTYANNASCAVSATGHGEYFIRATVARNICALMEYADLTLEDAANRIVMEELVEMGGDGGIIAVDKDGAMVMTFNTPGMFRGKVSSKEPATIGIYKD